MSASFVVRKQNVQKIRSSRTENKFVFFSTLLLTLKFWTNVWATLEKWGICHLISNVQKAERKEETLEYVKCRGEEKKLCGKHEKILTVEYGKILTVEDRKPTVGPIILLSDFWHMELVWGCRHVKW